MRKIVTFAIGQKIPDDARPVGVFLLKVADGFGGWNEEPVFYYDVIDSAADEELKERREESLRRANGPAKRR